MGKHPDPDPDPDPEVTQLLALLDAYESFPEVVQPRGPSPQPPKLSAEKTEEESRFAAKVVSVMSRGRAG
jgi:hypothetical protein